MLQVRDLDCELWEHEEYSQGMKEEIIEGICSVWHAVTGSDFSPERCTLLQISVTCCVVRNDQNKPNLAVSNNSVLTLQYKFCCLILKLKSQRRKPCVRSGCVQLSPQNAFKKLIKISIIVFQLRGCKIILLCNTWTSTMYCRTWTKLLALNSEASVDATLTCLLSVPAGGASSGC